MDAPPFLIPRERLGVEWHRDFELLKEMRDSPR